MKEGGLTPPSDTSKGFTAMGKAFDQFMPKAYVSSFAIRRA